jgi:hypothetical protein
LAISLAWEWQIIPNPRTGEYPVTPAGDTPSGRLPDRPRRFLALIVNALFTMAAWHFSGSNRGVPKMEMPLDSMPSGEGYDDVDLSVTGEEAELTADGIVDLMLTVMSDGLDHPELPTVIATRPPARRSRPTS